MRTLATLLLVCASSIVYGEEFFNEIYDSSGEIRPHYREVYEIFQRMSSKQIEDFDRRSRKDFSGDNALYPLPRLILESEISELRDGVDQRARALVRFLQDYYSGTHSYRKAGIFPPDALESIVRRYGEDYFAGKLNPSAISFVYGPDIIRGADGKYYVIEDNPGYVGGLGDLVKAREVILKRVPGYENVIDQIDSPEVFYDNLVDKFKRMRRNSGPVVMLSLSRSETADKEDNRLKKLMADRGVELVSPYSNNRIVVRDGKAFLEKRSGDKIRRREIGYLVLSGEPGHFDYSLPPYEAKLINSYLEEHREILKYSLDKPQNVPADYRDFAANFSELTRAQKTAMLAEITALLETVGTSEYSLERAKELSQKMETFTPTDLKQQGRGYPKGLISLIMSGQLPSSYSPGVDFIGDKEFYVYAEKLIEFYLNEKPILRNIPTKVISTHPEMIAEFTKNPAKYVVKSKDGRGGDAVFIGSKMSARERSRLVEKMRRHKHMFIIQELKHLSRLGNMIVDARLISHVDRVSNLVPYTPWGRGLPIDGDGKVNLSASGKEIAIIPVPDPNMGPCQRIQKDNYQRRAPF